MKSVDITVHIEYREDIEGEVAWVIDKIPEDFYNIGFDYEDLNVTVSNPL